MVTTKHTLTVEIKLNDVQYQRQYPQESDNTEK